jgi:tetratricopeptide (TPR) repeat protein
MASIVLPFVTTYDDKGAKKAQQSLAGLTKSWVGASVSVGVVVDQLGKAVRAAAEDANQQKQLQLAIRNSTTATEAQATAVEDYIGKLQFQKAVSDGELRPAMASLVRATGDVTKSQELLNLALDISAGTGRDLASVSTALARAQTGNVTALTRLGIPLDAAAVKSKDLAAIQRDLAYRFEGAADAAANSAEGGMKKLNIALDETYETVGNALMPVLNDYVTVVNDLAQKTLNADGKSASWASNIFKLSSGVDPLSNGIRILNRVIGRYADNVENAAAQTNYVDSAMRMYKNSITSGEKTLANETKTQERNTEAKRKAEAAAKKYADTLRGRMRDAVQSVNDQLEQAQQNFDDANRSMTDTFMGFASLADAFKSNTDAIDEEQDALRKRAQAYQALDLARQRGDIEGIAEATKDLADAEAAVTAASQRRAQTTTLGEFQKQIEEARKFGINIKTMIDNGLSQAGVAQFLNLGPAAGYKVSQELLDSGQFESFKASMADLAGIASSAGLANANAFFGGALADASANAATVQQISITVQAGLVSNPAQVGRDIIEAIKRAERVSGKVFASA